MFSIGRHPPLEMVALTEACRFEALPHLFRAWALSGVTGTYLSDQTYILDHGIVWG